MRICKERSLLILVVLAASLCTASLRAQTTQGPAQLAIDTKTIATPVSPTLYGMMTEEINHSYDGGLYAELISNRTFRSSWDGIANWTLLCHGNAQASMTLDKADGPSEALPTSLKITVTNASPGNSAGTQNSGYWGIPVKANTLYKGSFYAKADEAAITSVMVRLISNRTATVLASAEVPLHGNSWSKYEYTLKSGALQPSSENHLELTVTHPGTLHLQLVSLMPPTFHNRPNGNRADLMERMVALHPHFLRLPGGNYLEGNRLEDWFNWKKTIGPLVDRPGHNAPWGYWSTDGLGLLEYLEWCEDLHIEPVLAIYAGYALNGDHITPGKDLEPFVQAALDEVEYVTGATSTKWGAERAKDGHPAPFPLHYIEIGNEDFFDKSGTYDARFAQFAQALRKQYPQYKLIATTPVKETSADAQPDLIDDHYYKSPEDMMDFVHHYDDASRSGPKIFVGEWATRSGTPTPNFGDALGDAAWMTAMERNSDLIVMASYAPLFVNVNPGAMQWSTDLIGYNAEKTYGSPSYYAQSLFAGHLGDETPKSSISGVGNRFFYSVTISKSEHVLHLKLVNATDKEQPLVIGLSGVEAKRVAKKFSLHGATTSATNSISDPDFIHPIESTETVPGGSWKHVVPGLTIEVIDIPLQ